MNAKAPETHGKAAPSWWDRLSDRGESRSKSFVVVLIAAAVVAVLVIVGWNLWQGSQQARSDEISAEINRGLALLPSDGLSLYQRTHGGALPDATGAASGYLTRRSSELGPRASFADTLVSPEAAKAYFDQVESALASLAEREDRLGEGENAWLYWHVRQQLLFYASRNTPDVEQRKTLLREQLSILEKMRASFGEEHPFFGLKPDTNQPEATVLDLWEAAAKADLAFIEEHPEAVTLQPDPNLTGTITLGDGSVLELRFYSRVAPKAVETFVACARAGVYDGTAIHAVKAEDGVLIGGNPFSRLAPERPAIWSLAAKHGVVPTERSALLPAKKGRVAFETTGVAADPFHLVFYVEEPEAPTGAAVFAEIVSGLEALEAWLKTEVHDEAGIDNAYLPRERLSIATVRVEGTVAHPSDDSWTFEIVIPEVPETTPDERAFYQASGLAPADDAGGAAEDAGDGRGEEPAEDGDAERAEDAVGEGGADEDATEDTEGE